MGWTWTNLKRKSQLVAERLSDYRQGGYEVIVYKTTGSGLWTVLRYTADQGESQPYRGTPFIVFDLMERQGGTWGYKDMDESAGPYYYDCPVAFFNVAPATNQEWRNKVRAVAEDKKSVKAIFKRKEG